MNKRIIAALAASAVLLASGCSGDEPAKTTDQAKETASGQSSENADKDTGSNEEDEEGEEDEEDEDGDDEKGTDDSSSAGSSTKFDKNVSGFALSVNGSTGKMNITRAPKKSDPMGEENTWTIFVYLCGTDLESSGQGSASSDISQMLAATGSENVKFVIQTGGTSQWMNEQFSTDKAERYVITNGDIMLADSVSLTSMGDPATLADFLDWGVKTYPAEKMGVVFWDHGGGSITGACFDELNNGDSLSLSEINTAFSKVYANMSDKFEFIGFDCCLMGTAETANVLTTYARYFYGSQETEPGSGWDYTAIGNAMAEDPSINGAGLGKVVTDSFYEECAQAQQENECTFTIIDLEKFDDFAVAFNDYAKALYEAAGSDLAGIVRGVDNADNFGGNNKSEGYTNMVDIGGIIENCSDYADGSAVASALKNCIVYNKNGSNHTNASGLSIYYPLQVGGSNELGVFSGICISPYYLSLVDMVATGYTGNGYDNQVFFTEDGDWSNEECQCEGLEDDYFGYADEDTDNESKLITFETKPSLNDEGIFGFKLDSNGLEYTADVSAYIFMESDDGTTLELGETYDIDADWENGVFNDSFDGSWLALPDETLLPTYIVSGDDGKYVYTTPVNLNGKRTNLRIVKTDNGVKIEGAWDGIDENGMAAREIRKLKAGDKIAPIYYIFDKSDNEKEFTGKEYTWQEGDSVIYGNLPNADYSYGFCIDDIYGDFIVTDCITFTVTDDGISFSEQEED